jgi:hypothetical protein
MNVLLDRKSERRRKKEKDGDGYWRLVALSSFACHVHQGLDLLSAFA